MKRNTTGTYHNWFSLINCSFTNAVLQNLDWNPSQLITKKILIYACLTMLFVHTILDPGCQ